MRRTVKRRLHCRICVSNPSRALGTQAKHGALILLERKRIKRQTIANRRLQHQLQVA